jgi:PAS domain S-box-containing protein
MTTVTEETYATLRAENEELRQFVVELRQQLTAYQHREAEMQQQNSILQQELAEQRAQLVRHFSASYQKLSLLQGIIDNTPSSIFVKNIEGRFLLVNRRAASFLQHTPDQLIGKTDYELFPPKIVERWRTNDRPILESGKSVQIEVVMHQDDGLHTYITTRFPFYDAQGLVYAIGGISTDITERAQTQAAQALMQIQLEDAQQQAMQNVTTPIIPIADHIVTMPLVGTLDAVRAQQAMQTLLEGITTYHAKIAVLDITGLSVVDSEVTQALTRIAQAVRLLGAQVVLTGIQPHVAEMLVYLGVDLSGVITRSTLQEGVTYALHQYAGTPVSPRRSRT